MHGVPQRLPPSIVAGENLQFAAAVIVNHSTRHWPGVTRSSKTLAGSAPGWLVFVIMARPPNYPPSRARFLERSHSQLTLSVSMQHMAGRAGPRRCREWLRSRCRRLQLGEDQPQRANARRHRERVAGDDPLQLRDRRRCLAIIKFYGSHGCFVERRWPPLWTGTRRLRLSS